MREKRECLSKQSERQGDEMPGHESALPMTAVGREVREGKPQSRETHLVEDRAVAVAPGLIKSSLGCV